MTTKIHIWGKEYCKLLWRGEWHSHLGSNSGMVRQVGAASANSLLVPTRARWSAWCAQICSATVVFMRTRSFDFECLGSQSACRMCQSPPIGDRYVPGTYHVSCVDGRVTHEAWFEATFFTLFNFDVTFFSCFSLVSRRDSSVAASPCAASRATAAAAASAASSSAASSACRLAFAIRRLGAPPDRAFAMVAYVLVPREGPLVAKKFSITRRLSSLARRPFSSLRQDANDIECAPSAFLPSSCAPTSGYFCISRSSAISASPLAS